MTHRFAAPGCQAPTAPQGGDYLRTLGVALYGGKGSDGEDAVGTNPANAIDDGDPVPDLAGQLDDGGLQGSGVRTERLANQLGIFIQIE